jgi:hypothetical protein
MTSWLVPPIVLPVMFVVLVAACGLYRFYT